MPSLTDLNLKNLLSDSIQDVFDTMLEMSMDPADDETIIPDGTSRIVGSVGFAGKAMGTVNIHVPETLARVMTAQMLGMDESEIDEIDEVLDVVGEVCNMVSGNIKSKLCDAGLACELSIPSTTIGTNFSMESVGWSRSEHVAFKVDGNGILIEVAVKMSNS